MTDGEPSKSMSEICVPQHQMLVRAAFDTAALTARRDPSCQGTAPLCLFKKPAQLPSSITVRVIHGWRLTSLPRLYMAGGRKAKPAPPAKPSKTLVVDNGGYTLKAGVVADNGIHDPRVVPNCIARDRSKKIYVASDLAKCRDFGELHFRRPVERGFIVNWEAQKEIWDQELFEKLVPKCDDPADTRLILTEQPGGLPVLQTNCDQVVFEEYGFASYYRGVGEFRDSEEHESLKKRETGGERKRKGGLREEERTREAGLLIACANSHIVSLADIISPNRAKLQRVPRYSEPLPNAQRHSHHSQRARRGPPGH